jgi:hypothetical protein
MAMALGTVLWDDRPACFMTDKSSVLHQRPLLLSVFDILFSVVPEINRTHARQGLYH